jgi:hypothetical protein
MAADQPAARTLDTAKVRARLRGVWLALWLGAFGMLMVNYRPTLDAGAPVVARS